MRCAAPHISPFSLLRRAPGSFIPGPPRTARRSASLASFLSSPSFVPLSFPLLSPPPQSAATAGKRLESIGLTNTEENRLRYRQLLLSTPTLSNYVAGAILFEETLYQKMKDGATFPEFMVKNGIVPGIKVDKGLTPLPGTNGESICLGLDGLDKRCA